MNTEDVRKQAEWEIRLETFENLVEIEKRRLRTHKPWWKIVFPYTISITKDKEK